MNLCSEEGVHEEEQLLQLWTDHLLRHLNMVSRWVTMVGEHGQKVKMVSR